MCSLILRGNLLCFSFWSCPWAPLRRAWLCCLFYPPFRYLYVFEPKCVASPVLSRGEGSSPDLLGTFLLMQMGISLPAFVPRARCWLMFNLVSTRITRPFSAKLLSSHSDVLVRALCPVTQPVFSPSHCLLTQPILPPACLWGSYRRQYQQPH